MFNTEKDHASIEHAKTLDHVPHCEDYDKMISGMLYESGVPELVEGRFRARKLMREYNTYFPENATSESLTRDRQEMLRKMFGKIGDGAFIEPPLNIDYGCNISIGHSFYSNFNLVILDCGLVTIGNRVKFGPLVSIFAATHDVGPQSRRDLIEYAKPVTIGDDCWIGGNTVIMPGVTIGKGCTIGAGSVVTRSIPDFSVAVGSPARVVKSVEPVPDEP